METFPTISTVIRNRRTTPTAKMNGKKIPDHTIEQLLELADWAPTHANTEPWRFIVYAGEQVKKFCADHAALYKLHTPSETFTKAVYEKQLHNGDNASHIIIANMVKGDNPKIPVLEEIEAVSSAVQNILLAAEALGIATLWSTGGMTHHPALKQYFGLREEDMVIGLLYLGYPANEQKPEGTRIIPLDKKVKWIK